METTEDLRTYYSRVTPAIPELYNMAYAICGSYDLAEYALQYALMEGWFGETHGGMGFREGLRNTLRQVAFEEAVEPRAETPEFTWDALTESSDDPVLAQLAGETMETRRMVALRYGCGLSIGRIAKLMSRTASQVRADLEHFSRSASRKLPASQRHRFDVHLARAIRHQFNQANDSMPSLGSIYRSFEAEAAENHRPSHWASKIVKKIILCVLAILCALIFWLAAVLIQPTVLEQPQAVQEIIDSK